MLGLLAEAGYVPISYDPADPEASLRADAVVVNTCGFLEASKDESLSVIKEAVRAKQAGNVGRVVVAGCLVQRHRAKMLEWEPGIDAMVGVFDRDRIVDAVGGPAGGFGGARADHKSDSPRYWVNANALTKAAELGIAGAASLTVNGKDGRGVGYFEDDSARMRLTPRHYAYLRISEGCNQRCAFCTIPSIRGKMRSKPMDRVVSEAVELVHDGAFELNLIGQDTTSYGDDIGVGFGQVGPGQAGAGGLPALLEGVTNAVRGAGGTGWVRLMYAYPSSFRDEFIEAFARLAGEGVLCPYIDMPLQHASDRVLANMRRNVTSDQQRAVLRKLRERVPGMTIRTTFITGFPGETEGDHRELMAFVEEQRFEAMGVFEYSREDNTPAGTMEKDPALAVPAEVKARRRDELMSLQQRIVFERNESLSREYNEAKRDGRRADVLIDSPARTSGLATTGVSSGGSLYAGRTRAQAPAIDGVTYVQSRQRLSPGELVPCVIVGFDGYDLIARPRSELESGISLSVLR